MKPQLPVTEMCIHSSIYATTNNDTLFYLEKGLSESMASQILVASQKNKSAFSNYYSEKDTNDLTSFTNKILE